MVARHRGNRPRSWVRNASGHAADTWHRRVSSISVLFQDSSLASTRTMPRVCKWRHHSGDEVWSCGGNPWRGIPDGKVWVASSVRGNWTAQPRVATWLDEGDAPPLCVDSSRNSPACDRHLATALILGQCHGRLLRRLPALFHGDLACFYLVHEQHLS